MTGTFPNFMAQHGAALVANGYHILPIQPGMKSPGVYAQGDWRAVGGWQQHCDRPTTDAEVEIWSEWPECAVGIACGYTVGIDIDVPDGDIALQIDALARDMLGDTPLLRIGLAPKRLLVYRAEVPFPTRNRHPIQLLARGAQFVARSIHPDTGQPYTWPEDQPEDCDIGRLPLVEQGQCMAFLDAAYDLVPVELRPKTVIGNAPAGTAPGDPRGTRAAVESALRYLPNADMDRDSWVRIGLALKGALGEDGRDLWLDWSHASSKSGKSGRSDTAERKWRGFQPSSIGAGTLYYLAGKGGWTPPPDLILNAATAEARQGNEPHPAQGIIDQVRAFAANQAAREAGKPASQVQIVADKATLAALAGQPVGERQWIVPGWLPVGQVTMIYADGGVGKSMLALQLMMACATGAPWCGIETAQCASVGLFSEDDMMEVHRRAVAVAGHERIDMGGLWGVTVMSGVGRDNTLVNVTNDGAVAVTARWDELRTEAKVTGARLVVIDTAATSLNGNENNRTTVTKFVGAVLAGLAQEIEGAVLLLAHPSKSGKGDAKTGGGDMDSGSTGWNASVRSRISLEIPWDKDANALQINRRHMTLRKANYGPSGQKVSLAVTEGGVFIPMIGLDPANTHHTADAIAAAKDAVMRALHVLTPRGQRVVESTRSEYNIYKQMLKFGLADGCNSVIANRALAELIRDGHVVAKSSGPPSKPSHTIIPTDFRYGQDAMH